MTLSELGSIGEFVAAIAVLPTLVYLSIQLRQNSATTRAQIRQSVADSQIHYLNSRATDPFLREVSAKMLSGRDLDATEAHGLQVHLMAHVRLFENYFAQYGLGTMAPEDWRAMREVMKTVFRLSPYRHVFSSRENSWNSEFAVEVNQILREIDGPAV